MSKRKKKKTSSGTATVKKNHFYLIIVGAVIVTALIIGQTMSKPDDVKVSEEEMAVNLDLDTESNPDPGDEEEDNLAVKIPLSKISDQIEKFTYYSGTKEITFMVVEGSDGFPRVAFDACEVCGGSMGYKQVGDDVQCVKCSRYFKIDDLGSANMGGGCWPAHIPHKVVDDNVVIYKKDLDKGGKYF